MFLALAIHIGTWRTPIRFFQPHTAYIFFFFFITAVFIKNDDWKSTCSRVISLAIPFVVWCVITTYFQRWTGNRPMVDWSRWSDIQDVFGLKLWFLNSVLWFLRALIICVFFNPIISKLNQYGLAILALIFLSLGILSLIENPYISVWPDESNSLLFLGIFTFILGVIIRKYVGISALIALLDKYYIRQFVVIALIACVAKLLFLVTPCVGTALYLVSSLFFLPSICIVLSKLMPSLIKKINVLAPAMFFVYVSQLFSIFLVNELCSFISSEYSPLAALITRNLMPFPMMAVGCTVYFILKPCKIFDGWLIIKH